MKQMKATPKDEIIQRIEHALETSQIQWQQANGDRPMGFDIAALTVFDEFMMILDETFYRFSRGD